MMLKIYFISAIFVRFTADSEAAETINCNPIWRRVGDNVTIPCSYRPKSDQNGYLDIEWAIRNVNESDQTILTQAGGKVYVTPGWQQRISFASENGSKGDASLYFNSLDVNDSGIYNCKVKIDGKIEQKTCNLTVQVQDVPDIELMSKSPTTVKPTPTNDDQNVARPITMVNPTTAKGWTHFCLADGELWKTCHTSCFTSCLKVTMQGRLPLLCMTSSQKDGKATWFLPFATQERWGTLVTLIIPPPEFTLCKH
ncbi:CXADR-like membrane protein isoform X1 [Scyliorhinus canicula]|uniref:CXADR-like membrane protein isoform X1 n=1 Tax=Scyliorhinus canicula TaxID=7830 RepID=UPI0018F43FCC|nr:CXADR-like membrane protein isoform X1 [Scyliorhinus canicula]